MIDKHPSATMEFVADSLGCGYGKAQEEGKVEKRKRKR